MTDLCWYILWTIWTIGGFVVFQYVDRRSPPDGFPEHWHDTHVIALLVASGPIVWVRVLFSSDNE